jgi:hypothetical protein
MPTCEDCVSYTARTKDAGECRINGPVPRDRESERCPSRTFIPKAGKY